MAQRIFLVRHGETEWSRDRKHTSRTDLPLTPVGCQHAQKLARRLAGESFSLVLTSPLLRARETARLAGLLDRAEVTDDLREWDYGEYEGLTTAEIRAAGQPEWDVWHGCSPGGEGPDDVGVRADRVLERTAAVDGDVALFAHGHVLRVLGARWIGLPAVGGSHLALGTATLCVLGHERETSVLERWNDDGHLLEHGEA